MKNLNLIWTAIAFVLFTAANVSARRDAQPEPAADKTLSPYFHVKSDDPDVDQLPLKATSAEVDIAGVIARVKITQVYQNEGKKPLEAKYVFPGSTRAAVHGLKMTIGERTIVAKIEEREQAKKEYEAAKEAGKTASLLEQQRPNVFQMNVANILPGDTINVELIYTEMLEPEEGMYEFVFPTVVGPRYSETPAEGAPDTEKFVESPYQHSGEKPTMTFDMHVDIASGIALKNIACDTHKVTIQRPGDRSATIDLVDGEKHGGNRDFVLNYSLAGDRIETGVMLWEGDGEKFFVATVEPPQRVTSNLIPPREYIFVIDISGSMNGFPLDTTKKVMRNLFSSLRPQDHFNIVFFAGGSFQLAETSLPATEENVKHALDTINKQRGGGGTRLLNGLKKAYNLPRIDKDVSRTVVLATDGYVSVEQKAFDLIKENLGNTNVFAFGIGSSVNRYLITGVAKCGQGKEFVVLGPEQAEDAAARFRTYISVPVLTDIGVGFDGFDAYDVEPPSFPDIFAERPLVITGKYNGEPAGSIKITGYTGAGKYREQVAVAATSVDQAYAPIRYVWVRKRIARLSDYVGEKQMEKNKDAVTELGLKYSMLTRYTSFVAIDNRVRNEDGEITTVKQPLPMPQGVSDLAVGGPGQGRIGKSLQSSMSLVRPNVAGADLEETSPIPPSKKGDVEKDTTGTVQITAKQVLHITALELDSKGNGKLTVAQFIAGFSRMATKDQGFKDAVKAAQLGKETVVVVNFQKGVSQKLEVVKGDGDKVAASGLEEAVKEIVSRLIPPAFSGHVKLQLAMQ